MTNAPHRSRLAALAALGLAIAFGPGAQAMAQTYVIPFGAPPRPFNPLGYDEAQEMFRQATMPDRYGSYSAAYCGTSSLRSQPASYTALAGAAEAEIRAIAEKAAAQNRPLTRSEAYRLQFYQERRALRLAKAARGEGGGTMAAPRVGALSGC